VVIVAEPVSNTLLISATPQYFLEMKRLIEKIDAQPPQVVIQVLIAEVQLSNTEEFGVEVGVQSPILFSRSLIPTPTTITDATTGAVTGTIGSPGFNFNSTAPLPNAAASGPGTVGFQGINNLGLGRSSNLLGVGGFVFSAASDSFNLLIRALKQQGRVEILSRPQVQVADNQTGFVQVGQDFPTLGNAILAGTGTSQQSIDYRPIGITMRVTPRVNPDGKVLMRVEPQISSPTAVPVTLGAGLTAPAFNVQTVQTTVLATDGETIVLGGLITKSDSRTETGIPFLKDLPYAGALFRYRQQALAKREILIIMTPHIVRSECDQARILAEESRRISWVLGDVAPIHGHGMEVIGPASKGAIPVPTGPTPPPLPAGLTGPYSDAYIPVGSDLRNLPPGSVPPGSLPPAPPGAMVPNAVPPGFAPTGAAPVAPAPVAPMSAAPAVLPTPAASAVPPLPVPVPMSGVSQFGGQAPVMPASAAVSPGYPMVTPTAMAAPAPVAPAPPVGTTPAAGSGPVAAGRVVMTNPAAVAPPVPVLTPVGNRGFAMAQPAGPPADAPATSSTPTDKAKEGRKWSVFGR
jgi:hypothetical protein